MYLALKQTPMSGDQVKQVTTRLVALGFLAAVSSSYTKPVADAVAKFQAAMGIKVDGTVGPQTLACLVVCALAKRSAILSTALFLLGVIWNESGFYASSARNASGAKIADNSANAVQYGLFLLSPKLAGNLRVDLPIGTVQSDTAVKAAIAAIEAQWYAGVGVFNMLAKLVDGMVGGRTRGDDGAFLRLLALAHKLSGDPSCIGPILAAPAVSGLEYAWPAIVKLATDNAGSSAACAKAFASAIGNGYVDRVMAAAQRFAAAFGRNDLAKNLAWTGTLNRSSAPASTASAPASAPTPAAQPAPATAAPGSEPGTVPPEMQPGAGEDRLPVSTATTAPAPASPSTPAPAGDRLVPPAGTGTQTAGASGGLVAVLLIGAAVVLGFSGRGGGGGKRAGAGRRPRRR